jgi:cytochrome bd ubiquinol oxidase subunit I
VVDPVMMARAQMGLSLAFHMIFAALGIGLPLLMLLAEGMWLRTKRPEHLALAKKWSKGTGILFAIGAVSGTALSFELGLLWPRFMEFAGPLIGPAFALEGYAFFIEAIFIGLYLYGWGRLSPLAHWLCGIPVVVTGALSGILVVSANAWMQHPVGFEIADGRAVNIQPMAALFNPAWAVMALHSTLSCYIAAAFGVASIYAWSYLRGNRGEYERAALRLTMAVGAVSAIAMPLSGDLNATYVSRNQPSKLAAMEAVFETERGAPFLIGGWPDVERRKVDYVLEIPKLLSFMAFRDFNAEVKGLEEFPRDEWPNVLLVHLSFQVMVGAGIALAGISTLYWLLYWRLKGEVPRWMTLLVVPSGFLGFLALEAGWMVTEWGRQPWIIRGVMRTSEAVTPAPHVEGVFFGFTLLYLLLASTLVWYLLRLQDSGEPGAAGKADRAEAGPSGGKAIS